ncbi:MAG: tRNA (guanosine(37)-N1)-methyltransferase TrmD [Myxococcota bacterium]
MLRKVDVLTLFPDLVEQFLGEALVGSAREKGLLDLVAHDLRDWASDRRRTVDDTPYGGGPGMVMKPEPLVAGIEALVGPKHPERAARVILMSPQGKVLDQELLGELVATPHLVLVCGRYEGVDQRVIDLAVDDEVSIGDYVLSGGEVPAMVLIEGLARLVPGVLGNPESTQDESFGGGLLEGPQYTRPPTFRGLGVPPVLLSGNHAEITRWRAEQSRQLTRKRRPDLIDVISEDTEED